MAFTRSRVRSPSARCVVFSYARSPKKLERLARDAGGKARAGSPREAAQHAETLLLAVHWSRIDDVLSQAG
ncbi:MAG TPA: NAD(P)-binding domain-containing protein, partial [Vicinamibacterales bacterium]|nr:NAD(P)-binding domain-containing protein [Vicinamibacterales bacterium]